MSLDALSYSREQAIIRLNTPENRKALSRIVLTAQRWDELLYLDWGVSEACIFDMVEYLYGIRFARWGDHVVRKT